MGLLIPGYASLTFSPGGAAPVGRMLEPPAALLGLAFERRACWPALAVACRTRGECRKVVMHNRVTITLASELICRRERSEFDALYPAMVARSCCGAALAD
jgi:hypothetical protein